MYPKPLVYDAVGLKTSATSALRLADATSGSAITLLPGEYGQQIINQAVADATKPYATSKFDTAHPQAMLNAPQLAEATAVATDKSLLQIVKTLTCEIDEWSPLMDGRSKGMRP